jgi:hypothetical protein
MYTSKPQKTKRERHTVIIESSKVEKTVRKPIAPPSVIHKSRIEKRKSSVSKRDCWKDEGGNND